MLALDELVYMAGAPPLSLQLPTGAKGVLPCPDQQAQEALCAALSEPENLDQRHHLPDTYQVLSTDTTGEGAQKLRAVITARVAGLLKALRKYEQLSIRMTRHFSPVQLGGYMEELSELEEHLEAYQAWDLEQRLKEWREGLELPDLDQHLKAVEPHQQVAAKLMQAFVMPAPLTVATDPLPWLTPQQQTFLLRNLEATGQGWLILSTYQDYRTWPEAYRIAPA